MLRSCRWTLTILLTLAAPFALADACYDAFTNCEWQCECHHCGICSPGWFGVCDSGYNACTNTCDQNYEECANQRDQDWFGPESQGAVDAPLRCPVDPDDGWWAAEAEELSAGDELVADEAAAAVGVEEG
jgi:hypothetical protein